MAAILSQPQSVNSTRRNDEREPYYVRVMGRLRGICTGKNIDFRPPFFKVPEKSIDFRPPFF